MDWRLAAAADRKLVEAFASLAVMLARLIEMFVVALGLQPRQQRCYGCAYIPHDADIDWRPPPDHLAAVVDLGDSRATTPRIELPVGEIGPQHQQDVTIEHGEIA